MVARKTILARFSTEKERFAPATVGGIVVVNIRRDTLILNKIHLVLEPES